ncbi:hypothetical protein ACUOA8_37795, partial [Escherichia sp. SS-MK2]
VWNPTSKKMMMAPLENGEQRITVNLSILPSVKRNTFAIGGTLSFFSYTKFHYCNTKKKKERFTNQLY